jgi:hypothetical protein
MLFEIAITPDVFDGSLAGSDPALGHELRELLREIAAGGLVANLDKGEWERHVASRAAGWAPSVRTALISHLSRLDDLHRLVRHPQRKAGHPANDAEWLDLALESHHHHALEWIVASKHLCASRTDEPAPLIDPIELRASEPWQTRQRTPSVRMCASGYRPYLAPLLRHAKRLEIVDPYLSHRELRHRRFIELSAILMGDLGQARLPGEIRLHTWLRNCATPADIQESLDSWSKDWGLIKARLPPQHSFKVILWGRQGGDPPMHDRFLLTDQCGIQSGWGFDCKDEGTKQQTTWTLLDDRTWNERRNDYVRDIGPYRWLGETALT